MCWAKSLSSSLVGMMTAVTGFVPGFAQKRGWHPLTSSSPEAMLGREVR